MPRRATFALGVVAVLVSAGSVGSQDPFRARSEAESAAQALPIYAPDTVSSAPSDTMGSTRWEATAAPTPLMPSTQLPQESSLPSDPMPVEPVTSHLQPSAAAVALAVAAPAIASFVPSQARALVSNQSNDPRAIEPQAQPSNQFDTSLASADLDETHPISDVAQKRLFATVPDEIEPYFDLFMYVSKSTRGPLAQHMFVFQRDTDGQIIPYAEWKVSTGREKLELHNERNLRTHTPEGIFQLDPDRMHEKYWSRSWNNAPMHYAMFYDLMNNGAQSGLAIHAAVGKSKIARLGRRDSAGCIRLSPKHAKELFFKVRTTTKGQVPVLATNEKGSTDRWGRAKQGENGALVLQAGYRAVLFVENYDGREEISGPVVAYTN